MIVSRLGSIVGFLSLALGAILWEALGRLGISIALPPLSAVLDALAADIARGEILGPLATTLGAFAAGLVVAIVIALPLGTLAGLNMTIRETLRPLVAVLLALPPVALIPLLLVWFGTGTEARIAVVFLFAFLPIFVTTEAAFNRPNPLLEEMALSLGARRWQLLWRIQFPAAAPLLLTGIRLGITRAVKGVITGEMVLALAGLGGLLVAYSDRLDAPHIYGVVLAIVGLAVVVTEAFGLLERRLLRWQPAR